MYTLLIILALSGSGKSINSTKVEFDSKQLCEEALKQVLVETNKSFSGYDRNTILCLKTK